MIFAYCSTDLRAFLSRFQRLFIDMISKILKGKSKAAKDEKLFTKDSIMITTLDKDTLFGKGFESDADLENWRIINPSGVTGSELP